MVAILRDRKSKKSMASGWGKTPVIGKSIQKKLSREHMSVNVDKIQVCRAVKNQAIAYLLFAYQIVNGVLFRRVA